MPTRIVSLAPSTRPDDFVPPIANGGMTAAAAARFKNRRRVVFVTGMVKDRPGLVHTIFGNLTSAVRALE